MAEQLTSVRFDSNTLDGLKALAEVNDTNIATEVRTAVKRYIEQVTSAPDFRERAEASVAERQRRVDQLIGTGHR